MLPEQLVAIKILRDLYENQGTKFKYIRPPKVKTYDDYGYRVETGMLNGDEWGCPDFEISSAFTLDGKYLGDPKMAEAICKKHGIKPEYKKSSSSICTIGFCEKDQNWYGWSHRALCGFGLGDMLFHQKYLGDDEAVPYKEAGKTKITKLSQARESAVNFADYVS